MKVVIMPYMRSALTLADMPAVRKIQKDMKSDSFLLDYCTSAARIAARCNANFQIFSANAEIAKNERVDALYFEDSGNLDVWISCLAFSPPLGFWDIGFYLSDIWQTTGDNSEEIREYMLIDEYLPNREEMEF